MPKLITYPHVLKTVKWPARTCSQAVSPPSGGAAAYALSMVDMRTVGGRLFSTSSSACWSASTAAAVVEGASML